MKRSILILFFMVLVRLAAIAQIEDFLSSQVAIQSGNNIDLTWSIALGNTCIGTEVERSINGGPFINVFGIGGICGSPDREETYRFRDDGLSETGEYHYRLHFGNLGFVSMFVQFVQVWESGISVYSESGVHKLRVESLSGPFDLNVFNANGTTVFYLENVRSNETMLPTESWSNGTYIVHIISRESVIRQKFAIYR